ncbi:glutathione S-transferase 3-like [Magnolia sinica]|uniref:glutathione S-transferase 3-like n=1 Tax=Magnolia sinica TaxID=86752 RepID=UPI00265883CF|nr:glutathione S-transferase 3-like [Magnolia sinica]
MLHNTNHVPSTLGSFLFSDQMGESVVLFNYWVSPFGLRVRIALAEKGVEFEYKEHDIFNKSPLLLQANPIHKKVPVLIHNGRPICESLIIVQYIDEVWTNRSPLMPEDPYQRANARFWVDFIDKKIYSSGVGILKNKGEAKEEAKKEFIECLKLLEGELKDRSFFGGDTFGLVDITLIPFSGWFDMFKTYGYFNVEEECPMLMGWVERCMEKESVSKTLPDPHKLYDFMESMRKKFETQ